MKSYSLWMSDFREFSGFTTLVASAPHEARSKFFQTPTVFKFQFAFSVALTANRPLAVLSRKPAAGRLLC